MAKFCFNCGSPLAETTAFCGHCGSAVHQGPVAAPAPTVAPTPVPVPAPARKGSPLLKIALVFLGGLVLLGALGIAGIVYTGYRIKKAVVQTAQKNGIDLGAFRSNERGRMYEPCSLLTKEDASEILGLTIDRTETRGEECLYYMSPASTEKKQENLSEAFSKLRTDADKQPGTLPQEMRNSGMEELVKNITGGVNNGAAPYLTVTVSADGKTRAAAYKVALTAMGGSRTSESLAGIGDQAFLGPLDSILFFLKNGTGVEIDLRQVPKGRERGIQMARRILTRM